MKNWQSSFVSHRSSPWHFVQLLLYFCSRPETKASGLDCSGASNQVQPAASLRFTKKYTATTTTAAVMAVAAALPLSPAIMAAMALLPPLMVKPEIITK